MRFDKEFEVNTIFGRNKYYEMLNREAGKLGVKIERPKRFGSGIYMTIGIIPSKIIFGNDCIDIDMIVKILHEYENVVNDCINQTIYVLILNAVAIPIQTNVFSYFRSNHPRSKFEEIHFLIISRRSG